MPQDFDRCAAEGGKVRTVKVGADKYMHVCKDKLGKWHDGEVKYIKKGMMNVRKKQS